MAAEYGNNWIRKGFRSLIPATFLCLCTLSGFSQPAWRSHADKIIHQTDSLAASIQRTFHLSKVSNGNRDFRETWHYTLNKDQVAVFHIRYTLDSVEYSEVYYLDRGQLLCAEAYETIYDQWNEDEVRWGEVHYFDNALLMQYIRLGKEKNSWGRGMAVQQRFKERFHELNKNLRW